MKIVIPTDGEKGLDECVSTHFGRCETFTFLDENGKLLRIIDNTSEHMGGTGVPPELMKQHGANVLLCKGLGSRALEMCSEFEIDVYVCQAKTVKEIFEKWKYGNLDKANSEDACKEHRHE